MKRIAAMLLALVMLVMTGCGGKSKNIRVGAADIGGVYYAYSSTFAQIAHEDMSGYTFETKTTAGSVANLRLISGGYIDLGIVQADMLSDAYNSRGTFENGDYQKGYKALAALYIEACQIVVRKESGISSIDDLVGKTVSIGAAESGTEKNAEEILKVSGITEELVKTVNMDYAEAAEKLADGQIDAMFCTAGIRTGIIEQISKSCDIDVISLDDKCIEKLLTAYPLYEKYTIPAGTYQGQNEPVSTIGVRAVLIASSSLSDSTTEQITSLIFSHSSDFKMQLHLMLYSMSRKEQMAWIFHFMQERRRIMLNRVLMLRQNDSNRNGYCHPDCLWV